MALYEKRTGGLMQKEMKNHMGFYRHLHPDLELCFVLEGQATCQIGNEEYIATAGDALLILPYQIHEYPYDKNSDGKFVLLNLPMEVYQPYQTWLNTHQPKGQVICEFVSHNEIQAMLEIIVAAENTGIPYQMCLGFTTGILGAVLQATEWEPHATKQEELLPKVLAFCNDHYCQPITLSELAKQFYVNQSALSRLFNQGLGLPFNDFINILRVEEAAHLLRTTRHTVTEIAEQVGFGNVRTMNRAFLKHRHATPCQIRPPKATKKEG